MTVPARIWKHNQFAYVPHTSVSGDVWTLVLRGSATSAGAAGGTTLIDSNNITGSADAYNGRYWVKMVTGNNIGLWKRIVDDGGSGDNTLTFENNGFPNQVASGDEYEIWQSPEPVVVVDSSSGETNAVDAVRAEANDYWNGFYLIPITGSHRGKIAQITDFVSSTGTYTLASSFGTALSAGDVCLLRRFIEVGDFADSVEEGFEETPGYRLNGDIGDGRIVNKAGSVSFSTEVYGSNNVGADGVEAPRSPLAHLFQAAGFDEVLNNNSTTDAGSTTSALEAIAGGWEDIGIGTMIEVANNVAWVLNTVDGATDTLNVQPSVDVAPPTGQVVHAAATYRRNRMGRDGDYLGVCIEFERDGIRTTMTGCKGNVTLNDGPRLSLAWEFSVDHWTREVERAPYYAGDAYPTQAPIRGTDRRAYLDATAFDIGGFTASLNNEVAPKAVQGSNGMNGRAGFGHINASPGASFREIIDTSDDLDRYQTHQKRTQFALYVIYGDSPGNYFGVRLAGARVVQDTRPEDAGGIIDHPTVVKAHDKGTVTDGGDTIHVVDDFSFCIA